jgi:hypothetical protein
MTVCVPPLISVLQEREKQKGASLTETEVLEARDKANWIAVPDDVVMTIIRKRGFSDIDPDDVWQEWQQVRSEDGSHE